MRKKIVVALAALALAGCSTVTIEPKGSVAVGENADFQQTQNYFLWGLVGEKHINTGEVCTGKEPVKMQSQTTFTNGLLSAITLGIYAPRSAKVWCDKLATTGEGDSI